MRCDGLADLIAERLEQIVELSSHFRVVDNERRGQQCRNSRDPDASHESPDESDVETGLPEQRLQDPLPFQEVPDRCARVRARRALDEIEQNLRTPQFAQLDHRRANLRTHGADFDRDLDYSLRLAFSGYHGA